MNELDEHRKRLAEAFDRSFALPFSGEHRETRDFLILRLGVHWYALPVDELGGVQNKKTIRYLPGAPPYCLGLANVRSRLAAVYDLGALVGSPAADRMSWFLQAEVDPDIAFLVPKADRYLRVPFDEVVELDEPDGATVGALSDSGVGVNVLSVARIVLAIRSRLGGER